MLFYSEANIKRTEICEPDTAVLQEAANSELTVYDFADSVRPAACARIKKGAANRTIKEVKKLNSGPGVESQMKEEEEELSWFDKDLDDFDIPIPPDSEAEGEEEEDLAEGSQAAACGRRRRRKGSGGEREDQKRGVVYPVDLWYLLSNHIHPESLHKFAVLCKDAYHTTRRAHFWRNLYKRYYHKDEELPADLKTHAMERNHGLRARCIRALYILDPSLAQRVQLKGPFDTDPHSLVGHRCLLSWHQPSQGKWHFCFKLQRPSLRPHHNNNTRPSYLEDVRNGYNNIFYNPEDGCCVLQVTSTHFASTSPHVMGQLLSAVHMSLSHNFRHQRLRLTFDSTRVTETSASSGHALECVLDPAIAVRVFHWWDPNYPFPT
ncbi:putative transmembrane protein 183BP isoform X2 [Babylonia areolata]|uniref:putative transmembrane protein 183BP isoform X2 n=1 Tax=Babylonia areolata TaxID=304850 RepID=UPI003FD58106